MKTRVARAALVSVLMVMPFVLPAQQTWQLVEDLRIGGDASDMTIFTDIRGVVAGSQGHIFVLDARPQEIRIFDRTGKFVALAARKGQGPGEIANGNGLLLHRDAVWVNDPSNGRWSVYSAADGKYLRQVTIPVNSYGYIWEAGVDAEGRILDKMSAVTDRIDPATKRPAYEQRIRRVRTDGTIADTVPGPSCSPRNPPGKTAFTGSTPGGGNTGMTIPFLPRTLVAFDGANGYWCAPSDEYVLVHRSLATGDTLHTVRKPYTRVPVTKEQRDEAIADARRTLARHKDIDADYSLIPTVQPVFQRLDVDDKRQLWARRTTAPGSPAAIDVYDITGKHIAVVTTTIPLRTYVPVHIQGDFVYGSALDEDDVQYVVRARIVRGGR